MTLLNKLFNFTLYIASKYNIDESHNIMHSMNVLYYANKIFESEVTKSPYIKNQEKLIYVTSILHDMCDKKYMNEEEGIKNINEFLETDSFLTPDQLAISNQIMSTMSYSKVKKNGFPQLGDYQKAYNIVRESDLLTAYDFDRCLIYQMHANNDNYLDAFNNAEALFNNRVLKHNEDELFLLDYSKYESIVLHQQALDRIAFHKRMISKF